MENTILVDHNFIGNLSDNFEKGEELIVDEDDYFYAIKAYFYLVIYLKPLIQEENLYNQLMLV